MGSLLLSLGPNEHSTLCVPSKSGVSVPPVLSKSCNEIMLDFKVWFSRNSSSHSWTTRLGSLTSGSEPSLQWVDFCGISVLQFVSHPPSSYGIWFYHDCAPPTISLWLLLCLWMWGIFFGEFQCLPVDDCSAASCDSGVLVRGSQSTSLYSAILNQSLSTYFLQHRKWRGGGWRGKGVYYRLKESWDIQMKSNVWFLFVLWFKQTNYKKCIF